MSLVQILLFTISIVAINLIDSSSSTQFKHAKAEENTDYWYLLGAKSLQRAQAVTANNRRAKNVILFLGDGMSIATITASRILKGQLQSKSGEEGALNFEEFPFVSLIKTYNLDRQVPDSAGTATAFLCGVKANFYTIGVNGHVKKGDENCDAIIKNRVSSILHWAVESGKSAGFVTTTRVTHATPSASYAHVSHRDWESATPFDKDPNSNCKDIARQLVENEPGTKLKVILGGGRRHFLPTSARDPSRPAFGERKDGRNLIQDWLNRRKGQGLSDSSYQFVNSTRTLRNVDTNKVDYLFGAFNWTNMAYEKERDNSLDGEPSLAEMTEAAIKVLRKNPEGFVLLVEGGRIDHAHHDNYGALALHETIAFDKAIETARNMVPADDTLMIVTADHAHAFTINGYPLRGNSILGDVKNGNVSYTTLLYGNGPGNREPREDPTKVNTSNLRYQQHAAVHLDESVHAGEDVALYSQGPMAHLFHGSQDQSYVAHVVGYAACIGRYKYEAHCSHRATSFGANNSGGGWLVVTCLLMLVKLY